MPLNLNNWQTSQHDKSVVFKPNKDSKVAKKNLPKMTWQCLKHLNIDSVLLIQNVQLKDSFRL